MPWTIWRYTFIELWRVVFVATAVLVSVIAFAAAIKPLAEGALSPIGALKFMAFAVPPMLAYALPFSAGFGAALVHHRMAQDNETVAAFSGGISHKKLLVPALCSALILGMSVSALNEWVIPRFLHAMERMITLDVAQLVIRQIQRGQAAELGDVMIHAERIIEVDAPEDSAVKQRYLMERVTAVQLDDDKRVESDALVHQAWLVIGEDPNDPDRTICGLYLKDGVGSPAEGGIRKIESVRAKPLTIPDAFEEDPKYYTFTELRELMDDPDEIGFIDEARLRLAESIARLRLAGVLRKELAGTNRITLTAPGGRRFEVTADRITPVEYGVWRLEREAGSVRVRRYEPDESGEIVPITDLAQNAWIRLEESAGTGGSSILDDRSAQSPSLRFALQLVDVRTERPGGLIGPRERRDFRDLSLTRDPLEAIAGYTSGELLAEADEIIGTGDGRASLEKSAGEMSRLIAKLRREIISKQQERMAMSAAAATMLMLGSITAMRRGESLPLVVYLWSFFPALAMILLISSGQQHTHSDHVPSGVAIIWSGVVIVGGLCVAEFVRLARH